MGIFRFLFSCITQAVKIAIGVALTIGLFFGAGYMIDLFAAKKTAPPADPKLKPYADHGMPLTGNESTENGKSSSLYLSFFETLLNKKPDVMPPAEAVKKKPAAAVPAPAAAGSDRKQPEVSSSGSDAVDRIRERIRDRKPQQGDAKSEPAQPQPAAPPSSQPDPEAQVAGQLTYTLQLGSFQNSEVAAAFSDSLSAKGYESYIVKIAVPDKGVVYRVRLGKYKNLEDAQKMATELDKKEGISAFITSK